MVFYRKYRPQTIADLDLESVRERLYSILASNNIPHAFLFTGSKGLGKTSSARILAKAVNCEKRQASSGQRIASSIEKTKLKNKEEKKLDARSNPLNAHLEPCNICSACISITNGSSIDVIEIDAASNRGIDEIRDLREKVKFSPSSLAKKVYIIDEVHMLTNEAFNALLKTLEEPPSHVMFILCTTEAWKLPGTIVSRTFHLQFEKPTSQEMVRSLSRVVEGEKLVLADGVLNRIAELSDGAFRDGTKILEELSLVAGSDPITLDILEKAYKTESIDQEVRILLSSLYVKDAKVALETIQKMTDTGCDAKIVTEKAVDILRHDMLAKNGLEKGERRVDVTVHDINELLKEFNEAYILIKNSVIPSLPLELLVVKWCIIENSKFEVRNSKQIQNSKEQQSVIPVQTGIQAESALGNTDPCIPPSFKTTEGHSRKDDNNKPNIEHSSASFLDSRGHGNDNKDRNNNDSDLLKNLIELLKKDNMEISGVLRSTRLGKMDDEEVEIIAPFKFHGDKLRDTKVLPLLESHIAGLLGKNLRVIISVQEK